MKTKETVRISMPIEIYHLFSLVEAEKRNFIYCEGSCIARVDGDFLVIETSSETFEPKENGEEA